MVGKRSAKNQQKILPPNRGVIADHSICRPIMTLGGVIAHHSNNGPQTRDGPIIKNRTGNLPILSLIPFPTELLSLNGSKSGYMSTFKKLISPNPALVWNQHRLSLKANHQVKFSET